MQLVYRAASYTFQPVAPTLLPTAIAAHDPPRGALLHLLFYRGQVYQYRQPINPSTPISRTLNWRFSGTCNVQDAALKAAHA